MEKPLASGSSLGGARRLQNVYIPYTVCIIMAIRNIQLRVDEGLKQNAEQVLEELGLDMPTALRLFLKKVVKTRAIPFRVSLEDADPEVFTAAQVREILASRQESLVPGKASGPFKTPAETQRYLDSLKKK